MHEPNFTFHIVDSDESESFFNTIRSRAASRAKIPDELGEIEALQVSRFLFCTTHLHRLLYNIFV